MQPKGSRQLAPKGMRCNRAGGFYGGGWGFHTEPVSPEALFDFFTENQADW